MIPSPSSRQLASSMTLTRGVRPPVLLCTHTSTPPACCTTVPDSVCSVACPSSLLPQEHRPVCSCKEAGRRVCVHSAPGHLQGNRHTGCHQGLPPLQALTAQQLPGPQRDPHPQLPGPQECAAAGACLQQQKGGGWSSEVPWVHGPWMHGNSCERQQ